MKTRFLKLGVAAVCTAVIAVSLTSCGIFFDEENNFVGLNNILELIYGDDGEDIVDTGIVPEKDAFDANYDE